MPHFIRAMLRETASITGGRFLPKNSIPNRTAILSASCCGGTARPGRWSKKPSCRPTSSGRNGRRNTNCRARDRFCPLFGQKQCARQFVFRLPFLPEDVGRQEGFFDQRPGRAVPPQGRQNRCPVRDRILWQK